MPFSVRLIEEIERLQPDLKAVMIELLKEIERQREESITRTVFEEFAKRTEKNFNRVWTSINELAEAQKKTEESLNRLIKRVDRTEERLEGISNSVGYSLENLAYRALPRLLKKEGIEVTGRIIRKYYEENQINILGTGKKAGREILILGEVKVRPSIKEIKRFITIASRIGDKEKKEVFIVLVAHDYHPNTEKYLKGKGIRYYWSYELE